MKRLIYSVTGLTLVLLLASFWPRPVQGQDLTTDLANFLAGLHPRVATAVDGATTFAVTGRFGWHNVVLSCTGAETINTITGGKAGGVLYLENTDTDCTLADDDSVTAADAIDLSGTATNSVGATANIVVLVYDGTSWLQVAEGPVGGFGGSSLDLDAAGVRLTGADGVLTALGLGNGNDEDLTFDFDNAAANFVAIASGTGVTHISWTGAFSAIQANTASSVAYGFTSDPNTGIYSSSAESVDFAANGVRVLNLTQTVNQNINKFAYANLTTKTVDAATTFAATNNYELLLCTGAETINTITGGTNGMFLVLSHGDTDCTIADDDDPTAADAIDLTGTATNDVGAVKKNIVLVYNGTDWSQVSESDN